MLQRKMRTSLVAEPPSRPVLVPAPRFARRLVSLPAESASALEPSPLRVRLPSSSQSSSVVTTAAAGASKAPSVSSTSPPAKAMRRAEPSLDSTGCSLPAASFPASGGSSPLRDSDHMSVGELSGPDVPFAMEEEVD